jgi:hypothetical protein
MQGKRSSCQVCYTIRPRRLWFCSTPTLWPSRSLESHGLRSLSDSGWRHAARVCVRKGGMGCDTSLLPNTLHTCGNVAAFVSFRSVTSLWSAVVQGWLSWWESSVCSRGAPAQLVWAGPLGGSPAAACQLCHGPPLTALVSEGPKGGGASWVNRGMHSADCGGRQVQPPAGSWLSAGMGVSHKVQPG